MRTCTRNWMELYTVSQKKGDTILLSISLLNIDRFLQGGRIGNRGWEIDCTCYRHISTSGLAASAPWRPFLACEVFVLPRWTPLSLSRGRAQRRNTTSGCQRPEVWTGSSLFSACSESSGRRIVWVVTPIVRRCLSRAVFVKPSVTGGHRV